MNSDKVPGRPTFEESMAASKAPPKPLTAEQIELRARQAEYDRPIDPMELDWDEAADRVEAFCKAWPSRWGPAMMGPDDTIIDIGCPTGRFELRRSDLCALVLAYKPWHD